MASDLADALASTLPPGADGGSAWHRRVKTMSPCDVMELREEDVDIVGRASVLQVFEALSPEVVIHAAAMTNVDGCEADPGRAFAVNGIGTRNIAEGARRCGAHVVYISTDYVFDGTSERPYVEWDRTNPLSVYGRSKLAGEFELDPGSSVVRTSWVCGARGSNFARSIKNAYEAGKPLKVVDDQRGSLTVTADLACLVAVLATDRLPGVFHVTNQDSGSWFDVARHVVAGCGGDPGIVEPIPTSALDPPRAAPRPANSVLENRALQALGMELLPPWQDGLSRLLEVLD